jgi:hypothetical protein
MPSIGPHHSEQQGWYCLAILAFVAFFFADKKNTKKESLPSPLLGIMGEEPPKALPKKNRQKRQTCHFLPSQCMSE